MEVVFYLYNYMSMFLKNPCHELPLNLGYINFFLVLLICQLLGLVNENLKSILKTFLGNPNS